MIRAAVACAFAFSFGALYGAVHAVEIRQATAAFISQRAV
jgi:hypothetical protein